MDTVARAIGMDPLAFRLKNALRPGSLTITGEVITEHHGDVVKCLQAAAQAVGYGALTAEEKARQKATGRRIGKAVVALHKAPAMPPFTGTAVILKMNEDGTVSANFSLTDMGNGTYTSVAQIIAETLGFPVDRVKIPMERDTDHDPYDWQTVASKGLMLTGNAAILACQDLITKAYDMTGQALRANVADLDHDEDGVFVKHRPGERIPFTKLACGYAYPNGSAIGGPLVGVGRYVAQGLTNLDKETGQGLPALDWTYGAHGVVAEVDPRTGEYTVLHVASAFDVGRAVNPGQVRGQVIGGMLQGLGTATCEGYLYDQAGHLLNPNFTDNKIPTSLDLPAKVEAIVIETPQLDGPYGVRGVGEHSMIAVGGGLGNAIYNATGADLVRMPIRQEDVWRALEKGTEPPRIGTPASFAAKRRTEIGAAKTDVAPVCGPGFPRHKRGARVP